MTGIRDYSRDGVVSFWNNCILVVVEGEENVSCVSLGYQLGWTVKDE